MYKLNRAPNLRRLFTTEENVIIKYILNLNAREFPPRLATIKDIANSLRAKRCLYLVSINQAATFVKRRPKLKVKFNQKYNYKRALYKNFKLIQDQFQLIENIEAKHSIQNKDTYNFNKIGFIIGQILTRVVIIDLDR